MKNSITEKVIIGQRIHEASTFGSVKMKVGINSSAYLYHKPNNHTYQINMDFFLSFHSCKQILLTDVSATSEE